MRLWVLLLLLVGSQRALAQETGLSLLRIGVHAEASALGDAQVAVVRDAFAAFANPAGLVARSSNTAALSHRIWVGDLRAYDVAARFGVGARGAIGLAIMATDSGDLEARDRPGQPDGFFSAQFVNVGVSYARQFGPLRAGFGAKYLRERIFDADASGYAIDAGVQLELANQSVVLGAALLNVGRMSQLERERTELPRMVRVGAAVQPLRVLADNDGTRLFELLLTGELSHLFASELTRAHMGVAATVMEMLTLRAGYLTRDVLRDWTFGLGIRYQPFVLDYAYIPFEGGFEGPGHAMTLLYAW